MTLRIPTTATSPVEWIRRAGGAVNACITELAALTKRVGTLETFSATPFTVASITLTPVALPGSPVKGQTVYDVADDKVKTWDGSAWMAHY